MLRLFRFQWIAFLVCVISFATYAFASSRTDSASQGGEGTASISGWNVSNLHYRIAETSSKISAVEFDLDGPATQVVIDFDAASSSSFTCHNPSGYHWACDVGSIEIAQANTLRVIAVD